jgi:hypothetical protein
VVAEAHLDHDMPLSLHLRVLEPHRRSSAVRAQLTSDGKG